MKPTRTLTVICAALFPALVMSAASGCNGCGKKDDDDKPAASASASAAPAPTPSAPATITPEEDAGAPDAAADGDAGDAKPPAKGGPGGSGSIAACCAALQQNANSAPLDQKPYYMAAAQYCNGAKNTSSGQQAFAQIRQFLAGAKMPGACK